MVNWSIGRLVSCICHVYHAPCASCICIMQYPMVCRFNSYYLAWPAAEFLDYSWCLRTCLTMAWAKSSMAGGRTTFKCWIGQMFSWWTGSAMRIMHLAACNMPCASCILAIFNGILQSLPEIWKRDIWLMRIVHLLFWHGYSCEKGSTKPCKGNP